MEYYWFLCVPAAALALAYWYIPPTFFKDLAALYSPVAAPKKRPVMRRPTI